MSGNRPSDRMPLNESLLPAIGRVTWAMTQARM